MSMKPGATTQPSASTSTSPRRLVPTSVMWPSLTATSARRPGAPVPSTRVPPRITVVWLIPDLLDVLPRRYPVSFLGSASGALVEHLVEADGGHGGPRVGGPVRQDDEVRQPTGRVEHMV